MLLFKAEFEELANAVDKNFEAIKTAFRDLRTDKFVIFWQRVLSVSNHMNRNNASKDAKGFPLSNLLLLKDVKSTVDPSITLLTTVIDLIEQKEPEVLEIDKMAPDFGSAALAATTLMQQIPGLIAKLMPLEKEIKLCTQEIEFPFAAAMKEFIQQIAGHLQKLTVITREMELEVNFFGDNDFLGTPPYANVDSFARCWDQLKLEHTGKNKRAQRNAECYAFFMNVAVFLGYLQKTRLFLEAKKKKEQQNKAPRKKTSIKQKRDSKGEVSSADVVDSVVNQLHGRDAFTSLRRKRDRTRRESAKLPPTVTLIAHS